jgi:hypothetical protein
LSLSGRGPQVVEGDLLRKHVTDGYQDFLGQPPRADEALSKTPRLSVFFQPRSFPPEAFPIKASDHSRTERVVTRLGFGCQASWCRGIANASGLHIGKYRAEPA